MASELPEPAPDAAALTRSASPTVSWFELFYDLVVVAAVSMTNDVFLADPSLETAALGAVTMTALAWVWFLTTLYNNLFPGQDIVRRLLLVAQMAAIAIAGLAVDQERGLNNSDGLVAYAVALIIVAALIAWGGRSTHTPIQIRSIVPIIVAAVICAVGAFDDESRSGIYLIVGVLVSMMPILLTQYAQWQHRSMIRLEHLRERLGLFVLIILGLGFAELLDALHATGAIPRADLFALLFILSFAVWWIYFDGTFSEHTDLALVRWRLTLLAHLTLVFGIGGTLDVLILLISGHASDLGDAALTYFVACLAIVLLSFAALTYTAKGRLGVQGRAQIACAVGILIVGVVLVPQDNTSTYGVIGLSAAIVIINAVIAVWADVAGHQHQWRTSLGVAMRGEDPSPPTGD